MAQKINPSKLLPSAKSTSIVKTKKTPLIIKEKKVNISSAIKPIESSSLAITKDLVKDKKTKDFFDANAKLIKIDKFFKLELSKSQKKSEEKRKQKEKQDFDAAEKKLELPKLKGFSLPKISLPSFGLFERIKRFLFFTALGWVLPKIIEFIPKLEGIAKVIGGIYKFAEGLFGKLLDGFMSLVKFGGDLKDKTIGFIAQAKAGIGGNYQKEFDKLEKQFNNFVNLSILTGVLAADIGLAAVDEYNKLKNKNKQSQVKKPPVGRPKVTQGRGGKPVKGKPKVTTGKGGKVPGWWNKIFKGPFVKLKGPLSKFAGAVVPGLGAAVGTADAIARFKSGDRIGGTLASVSATLDGLAAGSAILAATGIGAAVPAAFGLVSMGIDVVLLVRDIVKALFPAIPMFSGGGRVVSRYQDGGTTRGEKPVNAPVTRTLKQVKRKKPFKIIPPKSQPGKDVGGKRSITKLYPDPDQVVDPYSPGSGFDWSSWLKNSNQSERKRVPNPYKALTSTATILKDIPLVGGIMGAAVDVALGQKPDKKVYQSLSSGIEYFTDLIVNQKVNMNMVSLSKEIGTFVDGGYVSSATELKNNYSSLGNGDLISKVLGSTIDKRINEAIQNLNKEIEKKSNIDDSSSPPGTLDDSTPFDYEVEGGEPPSKYPGRYLDHGYKGRDYQIEVGRAITVFAPGVVTYAQYNSGGFGRLVIVKHSNGQESYYAHLSKINVRVGESISSNGTIVGLTGGDPSDPQAGRTTGPHLHFELRDSKGNRITQENSGDNFFRFGKIKSARPRVGTLAPGEAGKPGQKFSIAQLVTLAKKAGFRGNNAAIAAAVAMAESSGDSKAHFTPEESGGTDDSYGLWQINMIGGMGPERRKQYGLKSNQDLWDPATNANIAFKMSGGSNFDPWSTYNPRNRTTPKYLKFLPDAQKALQKGDVILPEQPKVPSLKPNIPQMGGQQIEYNYGMQVGDEFTFNGPNGKQYKAHKTTKGFDFYTTGFFGLGSQKIDTSNGKNQQVVDAFIRERGRVQNGQITRPGGSTSSKVSIYSGHADMTKNSSGGFGTPGGIEKLINPNFLSNEAYINDLVARKVAAKASGVAVYRSPIKTDKGRDPNSNWERARRDVSSGITPFEMHHDEPRGSSGLMMGANLKSRMKNPFIKSLSNVYGIHSNSEDKGFFKYGGAILEISALTPSILKDQKTINTHVEKESSKIASSFKENQMQSGGIVSSPKSKVSIPDSFTSYNNPSSGMLIAYQPYIIREQVQSNRGSVDAITFPVPVVIGVNSVEEVYSSSRGY